MKTLSAKTVVITGAGSGIGRALALEAAQSGAALALADWNEKAVQETLELAHPSKGFARKIDVRSDEEVASLAKQVERDLGGADVIVNNAGVAISDMVGSMKRSDFEWLFQINFWGVVRGTEEFLPQLLKRDDAHVVNISSIFGVVAMPSQSAYNASKFAVRGFTEALRQELHGGPVHVTCVHPGGVRTNIVRNGRAIKNSKGEATTTELLAKDFDRIAKVTPAAAAHTIWSGVLRNAPRVLVGADAKLLDVMQRLLPTGYTTLVRWGQQRLARRGLKL